MENNINNTKENILKEISTEKLEEILDKMYLVEEYDEANQDSCPQNASEEVIGTIIWKLKRENIILETKLSDNKYYDTVGEFIAEGYEDTSYFISKYDGEYLCGI